MGSSPGINRASRSPTIGARMASWMPRPSVPTPPFSARFGFRMDDRRSQRSLVRPNVICRPNSRPKLWPRVAAFRPRPPAEPGSHKTPPWRKGDSNSRSHRKKRKAVPRAAIWVPRAIQPAVGHRLRRHDRETSRLSLPRHRRARGHFAQRLSKWASGSPIATQSYRFGRLLQSRVLARLLRRHR